MQRVIGRPNLVRLASIGSTIFKHDKLIWRISADKSLSPIPVIGADPLITEIRIIDILSGTVGYRDGVSNVWVPRFFRVARQLGELIQGIYHIRHFRSKIGLK